MKHPTSIRLRPGVATEIEARESPSTSRSQVINRDLDRLYALYKRTLPEIQLSVPEAMLIVDALNGTVFYDAGSATLLWASVEDSIRLDGLADKWGVDGKALVEKLRGLTPAQSLAVIDAAERFWTAVPEKEIELWVRECFAINLAASED